MLHKVSSPTVLILLICLVNNLSAQNKAYYLNNSGEDLIRIDLDSSNFYTSYSFGEHGVQKRVSPASQLNLLELSSQHLDLGKLHKSSPTAPLKTTIDSSVIQSEVDFFSLKKTIPTPQNDTIVDRIYFNQKWHKLIILYSDDHYVGGRQNQIDISISVESLGIIWDYCNLIHEHSSIMICHQNNQKQKLLTQSYLFLEKNYPRSIPAQDLKHLIHLTQAYNFDNLIEKLTKKWLEPKQHLKLIQNDHEVINGHFKYSITVKNISNKRYCFYAESYIGPAKMKIKVNDKISIEPLEAIYSSIQHQYFKRINNTIFLNPDEEISFSLMPNKHESCGECAESPYIGFQIYRYGINFYSWIFHEGIPHNGNTYSIYTFREIK